MTAYYNEIDPYAAQWLRNLIDGGHIASGDVDERSIADVRADDLRGYTQCHFFAGIGGWSYALRLARWPDDRSVWTGSCPCQPFSLAGKQAGYTDERHLWPTWARLIKERRPATVFGEQVASATKWLRLVRSDLETLGYAVGAIPIEAASAGADHLRDRFWFVADNGRGRCHGQGQGQVQQPWRTQAKRASNSNVEDSASDGGREGQFKPFYGSGQASDLAHRAGRGRYMGHSGSAAGERNAGSILTAQAAERGARRIDGNLPDGPTDAGSSAFEWVIGADGKARRVKPGIRLLAHGIPARVGKLRAFGNAIDPRPAAEFIGASMRASAFTPALCAPVEKTRDNQ